jgi:hypothetical protein
MVYVSQMQVFMVGMSRAGHLGRRCSIVGICVQPIKSGGPLMRAFSSLAHWRMIEHQALAH